MGHIITQVVILAGGLGTRLRPLTESVPKPMVTIHGIPFLQYQLELIKSYGFAEILILAGYLGKCIEAYFGDGAKFGLNVRYSYEKIPLGTGGALKNAENELKEEFLLLNGDTFLPIDYRDLTECFYQSGKTGLIVVYENSENIAPDNIAFHKSHLVSGYDKKNTTSMTHVDAGVIMLKKEVLDLIPEAMKCSLEEEIFHKLIEEKNLLAYPTDQRFYDIGCFRELEVFEGAVK
ncbi:MAG: NTP transferase domain-containing protein [Sedimentisphaerales bacterium]|nr:NTP transferase domain-containing protein [Sedimentisphaerales bacterium]